MPLLSQITVPEDADLATTAQKLADLLGDDTSQEAVVKVFEAGTVVFPADRTLEVRDLLAKDDIQMGTELMQTVGIPGSELEEALPRSYRTSTAMQRLLGAEEGDLPTSVVYDLIDLIAAKQDTPDSEEETALIGEVLARAVLGVTGNINDAIQLEAGLVHYRNAYNERLSELIDPDAEAAPEGDAQ